jgi:hypothetical protein
MDMPVVSELEKAYLAGIVDGEGCIGAARVGSRKGRVPTAMFTVFISMTDRQPPDMACALYGGHVRLVQDKRGDTVRKAMYCWQAYGDIGARFLVDILPYLRIKGPQAAAYLEARKTFTGGPRKGHQGSVSATSQDLEMRFACVRRIQSLNQREYLRASC